jgi:prepilin-type N-terminal cleavage/methylation domain-containing protein
MRYRQRGFSLVEILIVTAIVGAIVAIAVPALRNGRVKLSGGETTAVREMQLVVRAQSQYRAHFGKYAASLEELGPRAAALIPRSLVAPEKDGYLFAMVLTRTGYALLASPRIYLVDGRRTFYVNQSGVVHESWGDRPASADSPVFR